MSEKQIERARKGGNARRDALTPEQRKLIARRANLARRQQMTAEERSALAQKAALAKWSGKRQRTIW